MLHGFLNIDKPAGSTSHDVVRQIRRLARQKRVGHGGTLDPLATGVLPVALGNATRLLEYLQEEDTKAYQAVVRLGAATDTDDAEGAVTSTGPVPPLSADLLEEVLARFRGQFDQQPPRYAAIRVEGRRLYDYARSGEEVSVPPRPVTIERLDLLAWDADSLTIDVHCSKGTYIRSLARDIGAALGCGGHIVALRRTRAGSFDLATTVPLAALLDDPGRLASAMLPAVSALGDWPQVVVDAAAAARLRQGLRIPQDGAAERGVAMDESHAMVAILAAAGAEWQPVKVFNWSE